VLEAKGLAFPASETLALAAPRRVFSLAAYQGGGAALAGALGTVLPEPGRRAVDGGVTYLWSGPEAWLAMAEDDGLKTRLAPAAKFAAITDQSDGRAIFLVSGPDAREWLQKLVPVDLHESVFLADHTALTLAGHIPVQIWREADTFALACFRSFAGALHHALREAQMPGRG